MNMRLEEQILSEHSKANTLFIAENIADDHEKFSDLMELFFNGEYRVVQRAAWVVAECVKKHPDLVAPYIQQLISNLYKEGHHPAVKRNSLRILQNLEVPKQFHGHLINICFTFLLNKKEPVAIKVFAMTVLEKLIANEPDLKKELSILIEDLLPYSTAAFQSRGRKILNKIT